MISYLIDYLIKFSYISNDERELYEYGLFVLLFNGFIVISIYIMGIVLNKYQLTLTFLLSFIPLRIQLGGYHCKTPLLCYISFFSIFLLIIGIDDIFENFIVDILVAIISLLIMQIVLKSHKNKKKVIRYILILNLINLFSKFNFNSSILLNYILYSIEKVRLR